MPSDAAQSDPTERPGPPTPTPQYVGLKLQRRFESLADVNLDGHDDGVFHVNQPPFVFKWYFRRSQHQRLYVLLHGGANRAKIPTPIFPRWNYGRILPGNLISVFDPTMELSATLPCGWYLGTKSADVTLKIAQLAQAVADHLEIDHTRIVFYGSSAGGFTALMCARYVAGSTCLIKNPLLDISVNSGHYLNQLLTIFSPEPTDDAVVREFKLRTSLFEAFRSAQELPLTVWAQDTNDPFCDRHFGRFCRRFGLDPAGGIGAGDRVLAFLFQSRTGHSEEPPDVVQAMIRKHIEFTEAPLPASSPIPE